MNDVICIGSVSQDIFLPTEDGVILDTPADLTSQRKIAFELGAKLMVDDRYEAPGGCAANVSQGLSRLGIKAGCCSRVGGDGTGKWVLGELEREGIDIKAVHVDELCKTDLASIIIDVKSGERTIFLNRDANEKLEIMPEKIKRARWFFVSSLYGDWHKHIASILPVMEENQIYLAYNPGQNNLKNDVATVLAVARKSSLLMVNKDEAIEMVKHMDGQADQDSLNNESFLLSSLLGLGPVVVSLTDGARGAWATNGTHSYYAGSFVEKSLDATGAGDAFSSAFLAAYLSNKKLDECLSWGIANGSNVVNYYGGKEGLLSRQSIDKRAGKVKVEDLGAK